MDFDTWLERSGRARLLAQLEARRRDRPGHLPDRQVHQWVSHWADPKSSPQWPPPSCCSPRSRSSRPAAATPCCLCGYCATATAPANLIMLGWAPASSACSSSSRVHAGRLGLLRAKHRRGLPPTAAVLAGSGAAAQLVPRVGARPPLLLPGSAVSAGGLCWPSRIGQHATYTSGLLQARPAVRAAFPGRPVPRPGTGFRGGLQPAQHRAADRRLDRLAVLGTVAWTAVASSVRTQAAGATAAAARAGHPLHAGSGDQLPGGNRCGRSRKPWSSRNRPHFRA